MLQSVAQLRIGRWKRTPSATNSVGIDRAANAMHNVSLWETIADADQMTSFQPMLDLASRAV